MSVTRSQLIDGVGISSFSNVTVSNTTTSQNLNVTGISTLSNVVVGGAGQNGGAGGYFGGGGGGSGYTDGSVQVISTTQGGGTGVARVIISAA